MKNCCLFLFPLGQGNGLNTYVGWEVRDRPRIHNGVKSQVWISIEEEFPATGLVTHWQYWSGRSIPFRAMILRKVPGVAADDPQYDIIGIHDIPAADVTDQVVMYKVPTDQRVIVQTGDVIGFGWVNNGPVKFTNEGDADADDVSGMLQKELDPGSLLTGNRVSGVATINRGFAIQAITSGML